MDLSAPGPQPAYSREGRVVADDALIDERALSRLRWRCRRGLLENDLIIERFFRTQEDRISVRQAQALARLTDLSDNDLLDLLLSRREPEGEADCPEVHEVLAQMRRPMTPQERLPR